MLLFLEKKLLLLAFSLLFLSSCVSRTTEIGLLVPKKTSFKELRTGKKIIHKNVKSSSFRFILLVITFGHPNFESAVNEALKKYNGAALENVVAEHSIEWYGLFGFNEIKIKADVIELQKRDNDERKK